MRRPGWNLGFSHQAGYELDGSEHFAAVENMGKHTKSGILSGYVNSLLLKMTHRNSGFTH